MLKAITRSARALLVIAVVISCHGCDYLRGVNNTRLMDAARTGDGRGVYFCLLAGGDANVRDTAGSTALHAAVAGNFMGVVDLLLWVGARPDERNDRGQTPTD